MIDHAINILIGFDVYQARSVFFDPWESMEILYKVLASLHHPMASLHLPEEITMFPHRREDLIECRLIVPREKTPWIAEACSSNHESIEILVKNSIFDKNSSSFPIIWMYHLCDPILI